MFLLILKNEIYLQRYFHLYKFMIYFYISSIYMINVIRRKGIKKKQSQRAEINFEVTLFSNSFPINWIHFYVGFSCYTLRVDCRESEVKRKQNLFRELNRFWGLKISYGFIVNIAAFSIYKDFLVYLKGLNYAINGYKLICSRSSFHSITYF